MKTKRIIAGVVAGMVATALCVAVTIEWHNQGAGIGSLVSGCVFYTACTFALWNAVDNLIKERG